MPCLAEGVLQVLPLRRQRLWAFASRAVAEGHGRQLAELQHQAAGIPRSGRILCSSYSLLALD
jgi:hypothetical protein